MQQATHSTGSVPTTGDKPNYTASGSAHPWGTWSVSIQPNDGTPGFFKSQNYYETIHLLHRGLGESIGDLITKLKNDSNMKQLWSLGAGEIERSHTVIEKLMYKHKQIGPFIEFAEINNFLDSCMCNDIYQLSKSSEADKPTKFDTCKARSQYYTIPGSDKPWAEWIDKQNKYSDGPKEFYKSEKFPLVKQHLKEGFKKDGFTEFKHWVLELHTHDDHIGLKAGEVEKLKSLDNLLEKLRVKRKPLGPILELIDKGGYVKSEIIDKIYGLANS